MDLVVYRHDFTAGIRAMAPWLIGSVQFGLVIGISAAQAELPTVVGWLTGPAIFAGTAQMATIQMLDSGSPAVAIVVTVMVINLRLVLYSAAMARYWRGTPLWWRLLGGYLLVDPSFVVGADRYSAEADPRRGHAHYLGGAVALWLTWVLAITVGAVFGLQLPAWLQLEFLIPLFLIGEIVPKLRQVDTRRAVLVAAGVALVGLAVPMNVGVALGILAGVAAGLRSRSATAPITPAGGQP